MKITIFREEESRIGPKEWLTIKNENFGTPNLASIYFYVKPISGGEIIIQIIKYMPHGKYLINSSQKMDKDYKMEDTC